MPNELKYLNSTIPQIKTNSLSSTSELSKIKGVTAPIQGKKSFFSNFGGNTNNFLGTMGAISNIASVVPSVDKNINTTDAAMQNVRDSANKALMSGSLGPWGMAAGAINSVIDKTGGFTDASQGLGKGTDTLNAIASMAIPGAGWFTKKTDKFAVDDTLKNSSGFTGTLKDATKVAGNANAKFLFGRNKANEQIADMKLKQNTVTNILDKNKDIKNSLSSNTQDLSFGNQFKNQGGWNQGSIQFGQDGMKIKDLSIVKKIARKSKNKSDILIPKHAKGGTLEKQGNDQIENMSIIPGGALHAHKHNLNSVDEDLAKQVTNKGVPVVSFETGGEINQHAEIERGEIIFRDEITEKLEELWEDGSEEAMIEAGKLIADEICNNTIDKSGEYEINKLQKGGIIHSDFENFRKTLPVNLQDTTNYRLLRYWELNGKPKSFNTNSGMFSKQDDGYHANSVAYNQDLDEYEFMKLKDHPTVKMELDWYNSEDGKSFKKQYKLLDDPKLNYYKYIKNNEIED